MNQARKESFRVRIISVGFAVLALAVFKPFGLGTWRWEAYVHLLTIFVLGLCVCMLTEAILRYIVGMPRSLEQGVSYIIRRNLWFQIINTPLMSLIICLYRHFVLSDRTPANQLSWSNYFETLVIMAFISFAIGLYWRFKFRSRYLALELEETRQLNEQLKRMQTQQNTRPVVEESNNPQGEEAADHASAGLSDQADSLPNQESIDAESTGGLVTLTGTTSDTITLQIADLLFVETIGNYVKVCHLREGKVRTDMLRATSKQMEEELSSFSKIVRCHRAFLVNLQQVEQIVSKSGNIQLIINHSHDSIPVSRSNVPAIKAAVM